MKAGAFATSFPLADMDTYESNGVTVIFLHTGACASWQRPLQENDGLASKTRALFQNSGFFQNSGTSESLYYIGK